MESPVTAFPRDAMVAAISDQVSADLDGEVVILHLNLGEYYGLDGAGARVWQLVKQPISVRQIEEAVLDEYDVDPAVWARDLDALLRGLLEKELIEVKDAPAATDA